MKTAIELGKDGTRTVFHRAGDESWTHETGPVCEFCFSGVVPILEDVRPPGKYGSVQVLYDEGYSGFLGFEVDTRDARQAKPLYSSLDTLPKHLRHHVSTRGRDQFCVEDGCLNRPWRNGVCQKHGRGQKAS